MIVYVESNFVLESAFAREEHENCSHIIALAERQQIVLALPTFCLGEPYETWVRRSKDRRALLDRFGQEVRELSRSQPYSSLLNESQSIMGTLIQSGEEEKKRLDTVISKIIDIATIIPTERDTILQAIRLQSERSLSPQDSIVYSSVLIHMNNSPDEPKCFLTKNSKDFANPDVYEDLRMHNCKLLTSFRGGVGYIESQAPNST